MGGLEAKGVEKARVRVQASFVRFRSAAVYSFVPDLVVKVEDAAEHLSKLGVEVFVWTEEFAYRLQPPRRRRYWSTRCRWCWSRPGLRVNLEGAAGSAIDALLSESHFD